MTDAATEGLYSIWPYFLTISIAFCVSLIWLNKRANNQRLSVAVAMDASLVVMVLGFLGSRLFHVFFEEPQLYRDYPMQILRVWEGGFVWYGGAFLGIFGGLCYLAKQPEPLGKWLDLFAPLGPLGYAIGRVACWIQGCCFGRFCDLGEMHFQFPTQAFAVIWETCVLMLLIGIERNVRPSSHFNWLKPEGTLFCFWLILHGIGRFIMEAFRGDDRGPTFGNVSISMFLSVVLISFGIFYIQRLNTRR